MRAFPQLLRWAWRRSLSPPLLVLTVLLFVFAATRDWKIPSAWGELLNTNAGASFTRQGVWTVLAPVLLALWVHRTISLPQRWRRREGSWIGALPLDAGKLLLAFYLAALAGGAALLLAVALEAELLSDSDADTARWRGALEHPAFLLAEGDAPRTWTEETVAAGTLVRFRPTVAPGSGPAVEVTAFVCSLADPATRNEERALLFGRSELLVEVPPGGGPYQLGLEREGSGAVAVLPEESVDLLIPDVDARGASWALFGRLLVGLAVWCALGLALGAWMRPILASLLLFCVWLVAWTWWSGPPWLPAGDLPRAWGLVGEGLVPPPIAPASYIWVPILVGLALIAARRGLRGWREV